MRNTLWILFAIAVGSALGFLVTPEAIGQAPRPAPKGAITGKLALYDRQGKIVKTVGESAEYRTITLSPDGKRIGVERTDASQNRDIVLIDIATGKTTRFTSDPGWDAFPLWSPDGKRMIFTSNRGSNLYNLYEKPVDGSKDEVLFFKSAESEGPTSWSRDGRYLLYYSLGQPTHGKVLAVNGPPDRQPIPIVDPKFTSITPRFSPDGRWIAYTTNESGKNGISVRPFDSATGAVGAAIIVSGNGGRTPLWRGDGKEMFYLDEDGTVIAREVTTKNGFHAGDPVRLFKVSTAVAFWDATPDGKRFVMPVADH
jgi:Tol biopolymer transport system component